MRIDWPKWVVDTALKDDVRDTMNHGHGFNARGFAPNEKSWTLSCFNLYFRFQLCKGHIFFSEIFWSSDNPHMSEFIYTTLDINDDVRNNSAAVETFVWMVSKKIELNESVLQVPMKWRSVVGLEVVLQGGTDEMVTLHKMHEAGENILQSSLR